jgi:hypothetical protein
MLSELTTDLPPVREYDNGIFSLAETFTELYFWTFPSHLLPLLHQSHHPHRLG